jgi:hypothetical protein
VLNLVAHLEHHANDKPIDLRLKTSVRRIDWCDGTRIIQTTADAIDATHIVVATGCEREPHIPEWPGRQTFTGELLHSSAYRTMPGGFPSDFIATAMYHMPPGIADAMAEVARRFSIGDLSEIGLPRPSEGVFSMW